MSGEINRKAKGYSTVVVDTCEGVGPTLVPTGLTISPQYELIPLAIAGQTNAN